jgi:hypothetical protein
MGRSDQTGAEPVSTLPPGPGDLDEFRPILSEAVSGATAVSDIEAWLELQPYVRSVLTEDYLLKSHPPQRRFIVELSLGGAPAVMQAIDVYTFDDQRFELRDIHDA